MAKVRVTKYKDINKTYPEGCAAVVDTNSEVIGMVTIPLADYPVACGENPVPTKLVLLINDPFLGNVWIDETIDSWFLLTGEGSTTTINHELTEEFVIAAPSATLTSALLTDSTINLVLVDNVPVQLSTLVYNALTGTITFPAPLGIGQVVTVVYHKN